MKLCEIAVRLGADIEGDGETEIDTVEPLESAGPRALSFVSNPRYVAKLSETRAGAVILGPGIDGPGCPVLRVPNAYVGFVQALGAFEQRSEPEIGIDPSASLDPSSELGEGARIGAHVSIGARARLGRNAVLHPGVVIYPDVEIGDGFVAHANAVVRERVRIGDRVTLQPGVVIGGDGFGFLPLPGGGVVRIPQIGTVEIGDDVEVGANTTVDRATIGVTRIGSGTKLDNLVMIAHGCQVGEEALIAAQSGLAGSTEVGARVQLGGQVGAAGHLKIGAGARVAAQSGISNDVPAGATIGGYPAIDHALWRRVSSALQRLPELLRRVRRIEKHLGHD